MLIIMGKYGTPLGQFFGLCLMPVMAEKRNAYQCTLQMGLVFWWCDKRNYGKLLVLY